jgi:hypothetical protein
VRRLALALLTSLLALPPHDAHAQIIRTGRAGGPEPSLWVSGGIGLQQGWTVTDGTTQTRWRLSDGQSYLLAVERPITRGVALGLRGSRARVSVDYTSTDPLAFTGSRDADATISQALAMLHITAGRDLHTVIELGAGATIYSGFRERGTGTDLPPDKADADFTFVLGYGIGYSFSNTFQIDVVQDLATALHQKTGLSAGDDSSVRISGTRLVARFGLGS